MIGIIAKPHQVPAVEEFFELFKTPWEFYRPGRAYDVVIASAGQVPEAHPRLLLVYGAEKASCDEKLGVRPGQLRKTATLTWDNRDLPVYGGCLSFEHSQGRACLSVAGEAAGVRIDAPGRIVMRLGYDLFEEVRFLLANGQPLQNAEIPTLDLHVRLLRRWMVEAGIGFVEIPAVPAGHDFCVCLTHDIDFVGIRNHKFDHTMWGFLYRSTVGSLRNFVRGRLSLLNLLRNWLAALTLPLVYLGWAEDFWEPFFWYLKIEEGLPATYFLIPFQGRAGERVSSPHASRRAARYEVEALGNSTAMLLANGCELGVHGLDAWHSADRGREEMAKIAAISGASETGVRMHWLLREQDTFQVLEEAGFSYDSTVGYNHTIGYRNGTTQVFRPLGAKKLLELPLHIQDGALFYPDTLDLSQKEAGERCLQFIQRARESGGVLTLLWHDRSHAPERLWGDFYAALLSSLRSLDPWFGSAAQITGWFRKRREVSFAESAGRPSLHYEGEEIMPPLTVRVHRPAPKAAGTPPSDAARSLIDVPWSGRSCQALEQLLDELSMGSTSEKHEGAGEIARTADSFFPLKAGL